MEIAALNKEESKYQVIKKYTVEYYSSICAFLFFALALVLPSGYSYGPALLALISIPFLFSKKSYSSLDTKTLWLIAAFFSFSIIWALEIFIHYSKYNNIEKPIRFFFSIAILLYLLRYPPKQFMVWLGIAFGAIGTGVFALIIKLTTSIDRASGFSHNAIQYGNISILLGFLSLVGILWALQQQKYKYSLISLLSLGFILGLTASILSGSRGGWIGAPLILLYILTQFKYFLSKKIIASIIILFLAIIYSAYLVPQTGLNKRVNTAIKDIKLYQEGKTKTSVGTRLEFWRAAIIISKEKPIFGWGKPAYLEKLEELVKNKVVNPAIISDPHNMYLTMLAFRGVIGLISLLALFIIPIYVFRSKLDKSNLHTIPLSVAGVTVALSFIDFGLTQTTLKFNSGTTVFCFSIIILYATLHGSQIKLKYPNSLT